MGRTIYSRRHTEASWVDASAKDTGGQESLRYRISPIDKKYDALEALELELEKQIDKIDPDVYDEYSRVLEARRERLDKARLRERGEPPQDKLAIKIKLAYKVKPDKPVRRYKGFADATLFVCLFVLFIVFWH